MNRQGTPRSRRSILKGIGVASGAALAGGFLQSCSSAPPGTTGDARRFLAGDRYFIAHRGAGDEAPEHTLAAYTRIVDRGAAAVEVSVHQTADGVLVCHHDPDLVRTCNGFAGVIKQLTWNELSRHRVDMSHYLGPGWGPQPIPRLDDVLDQVGGRAILFVEPKDPAAAGHVLSAVAEHRLQDTVVYKQYYRSTGDKAARRAGLAVWNYYDGTATEADMADIAARSDAIGAEANEPVGADRLAVLDKAVATGKPVVAWAIHRRSLLDDLAARGVRGFMCSSWSYLAGDLSTRLADDFGSGRVSPGDLPTDFTAVSAPVWNTDDSLGLAAGKGTQSLTMGSMSPIRSATYSISFEMRYGALPPQSGQHAGIALGRRDDTPYRFRGGGTGSGALVILRGDGTLELREVPPDNMQSTLIASSGGAAAAVGRWESFVVTVRPAEIIVTRTPDRGRPSTVRGRNPSTGTYFALSRNYGAPDASADFRRISVVSS